MDYMEAQEIKEICPECGEIREDDDRVKAGMKCAYCAGYFDGEVIVRLE